MVKKLYFISDIHIGSNQPTNWFQESVHTPYLEKILSFIRDEQQKNNDVQELIILGDLLDQWMYKPDVCPPGFQEIISSNPRLFGGVVEGKKVPGAFLDTLDALNGNITYMNGNHDMFITAADIAKLKSPQGHSIRAQGSLFYTPENCNGQLICSHGHAYSLFNAPNMVSYPPNNKPIPIGFFVSRFAARWSSQHFTADKPNVAYMKDSGNPNGPIFTEKALEGIWSQLKEDTANLSNLLISALLNATNNVDTGFKMPNGDLISVDDVKTLYKDMYSKYPESSQIQKEYFPNDAGLTRLRALIYSDAMNDLWEFAHFLAEKHQVVVMGHTHVPKEKMAEYFFPSRKAIYCNSGFGCPSIPDMEKSDSPMAPTFVEIAADKDAETFVATVYKVVKNGDKYSIEVHDGPLKTKM